MLVSATPNVTNNFIQGMLMGSSDLKYETKVQKLKVWAKLTMVRKVHRAIMEDDGQKLDEGNPENNNDCEEAPNDLNIQIRQLSIGTTRRPRRSHRIQRTTNATIDGDDSSI